MIFEKNLRHPSSDTGVDNSRALLPIWKWPGLGCRHLDHNNLLRACHQDTNRKEAMRKIEEMMARLADRCRLGCDPIRVTLHSKYGEWMRDAHELAHLAATHIVIDGSPSRKGGMDYEIEIPRMGFLRMEMVFKDRVLNRR